MFQNANIPKTEDERKRRVDNMEQYFPPVYDQGQMYSCTANAAAFAIEFYSLVRRNLSYSEASRTGQYRPVSRLFIYYNARRLIDQWMFENGASIRATLGALKMFGAPYENFWPYDREKYWVEPDSFVYALADINKIDSYILHEDNDREKIINDVKYYLAAGIPSVFGFVVYESHDKNFTRKTGEKSEGKNKTIGAFPLPYKEEKDPEKAEKEVDRHVVVAVGYDDTAVIENPLYPNDGTTKTTGAFKIRNSWGTSWGEDGYGWLPYEYVRKNLAYNFWSLLLMKYIDIENFGIILDKVTIPR